MNTHYVDANDAVTECAPLHYPGRIVDVVRHSLPGGLYFRIITCERLTRCTSDFVRLEQLMYGMVSRDRRLNQRIHIRNTSQLWFGRKANGAYVFKVEPSTQQFNDWLVSVQTRFLAEEAREREEHRHVRLELVTALFRDVKMIRSYCQG